MTRLAVALIQVLNSLESNGKAIELARKRLRQSDDAKVFFEHCYGISDRFNFSPDFVGARTVTWLGYLRFKRGAEADYARSDYFLVVDDYHRIASIHHHLAFGAPVDLTDCDSDRWRSFVHTLHELYWSWNRTQDRLSDSGEVTQALDPFIPQLMHRSDALFASRGFYMSLYDAEPELIKRWRDVAPALYSLLYLHTEGFDHDRAPDALAGRMAQSTEFFVSFYAADAILSLSRPYPAPDVVAPYAAHNPAAAGYVASTESDFAARLTEHADRFEPYDLLPEYPALRYLDLSLTEFATNARYGQWHIRGRLDTLAQANPGLAIPQTVVTLPRLDRVYYRTTSMSVLRLPVARDFAALLIGEQGVGANVEAIDGMKSSLLNTLVTILTIATLVIGLVQLITAFLP
jgi:hypothetical protein